MRRHPRNGELLGTRVVVFDELPNTFPHIGVWVRRPGAESLPALETVADVPAINDSVQTEDPTCKDMLEGDQLADLGVLVGLGVTEVHRADVPVRTSLKGRYRGTSLRNVTVGGMLQATVK